MVLWCGAVCETWFARLVFQLRSFGLGFVGWVCALRFCGWLGRVVPLWCLYWVCSCLGVGCVGFDAGLLLFRLVASICVDFYGEIGYYLTPSGFDFIVY